MSKFLPRGKTSLAPLRASNRTVDISNAPNAHIKSIFDRKKSEAQKQNIIKNNSTVYQNNFFDAKGDSNDYKAIEPIKNRQGSCDGALTPIKLQVLSPNYRTRENLDKNCLS